MPLIHMGDMLHHANQHRYAVTAFGVTSLAPVKDIIRAAERLHAPVILTVSESELDDFELDLLIAALQRAAQYSTVPMALHLDRAHSIASAVHAINQGCTAVSLDCAGASLDENTLRTRELVEIARACGIPVEGRMEAGSGDSAVSELKSYCEHTGVDSLALAGQPGSDVDHARDYLNCIIQALQIPLAQDGNEGMDDELLATLVEEGVARINLSSNSASNAASWMERSGSAGKAGELLEACRPWRPVEHVILYNTEGLDEEGVNKMMAEGRRVLSEIPGVLEVFTGHAVQENANYRHCWVVRFTDRAVIDSYRDHPDHQRFADECFRPYAGGRTSIDYEDSSR